MHSACEFAPVLAEPDSRIIRFKQMNIQRLKIMSSSSKISTRFLGTTLLAALGFCTASASAVGTRYFVVEGSKEFQAGELNGVSINSAEQLVAGMDLTAFEIEEAPIAWSAVEHEGALLIATGPKGKLLRHKDGKTTEIIAPETLALTSITKAFGNKILVGSMPGGKLYELKGDKLEVFTELKEAEHIWDLAFDEQSKVVYAATGPKGNIMRIASDGTAQVYFSAEETNFMTVAVYEGAVYAGSSGPGLLYKITGPGRAEVVYDFAMTEVRSLSFAANGDLFVIANEVKGGARSDRVSPGRLNPPSDKEERGGKGVLYRFDSELTPEKIYASAEEMLVFLTLSSEDLPLVGTGSSGKLIQIGKDHQTTILADIEERQVIWAQVEGDRGWVLGSDPVVAHKLRGFGGKEAIWTSSVQDAGIRARFGRLAFESQGEIEYSTRSGNTEKADKTWSVWSKPIGKTGELSSPAGRYLQVRARFLDGVTSNLERLNISFVTDNLRPVITSVVAAAQGQVQGSQGVSVSGATNDNEAPSNVTVTWDTENPDADELRYFIEYRPAGSESWTSLLESTEIYSKPTYDWETNHIPEGSYQFRITASDEVSNPLGKEKKHTKVSNVFVVDNTAPTIEDLKVVGQTITGAAVDGIGPIRSIEVQVNGQGQYYQLDAQDGIFDQKREGFSVDVATLLKSSVSLIVIRAFDSAGNSAVGQVSVRK